MRLSCRASFLQAMPRLPLPTSHFHRSFPTPTPCLRRQPGCYATFHFEAWHACACRTSLVRRRCIPRNFFTPCRTSGPRSLDFPRHHYGRHVSHLQPGRHLDGQTAGEVQQQPYRRFGRTRECSSLDKNQRASSCSGGKASRRTHQQRHSKARQHRLVARSTRCEVRCRSCALQRPHRESNCIGRQRRSQSSGRACHTGSYGPRCACGSSTAAEHGLRGERDCESELGGTRRRQAYWPSRSARGRGGRTCRSCFPATTRLHDSRRHRHHSHNRRTAVPAASFHSPTSGASHPYPSRRRRYQSTIASRAHCYRSLSPAGCRLPAASPGVAPVSERVCYSCRRPGMDHRVRRDHAFRRPGPPAGSHRRYYCCIAAARSRPRRPGRSSPGCTGDDVATHVGARRRFHDIRASPTTTHGASAREQRVEKEETDTTATSMEGILDTSLETATAAAAIDEAAAIPVDPSPAEGASQHSS